MKLRYLESVNRKTRATERVVFGAFSDQTLRPETQKMLQYLAFGGQSDCDVALVYWSDGNEMKLQRNLGADGVTRTFLHKKKDGKWQGVGESDKAKSEAFAEEDWNAHFLTAEGLGAFDGGTDFLPGISTLYGVYANADRNGAILRDRAATCSAQLKTYSAPQKVVSQRDLEQVASDLADCSEKYAALSAKAAALAAMRSGSKFVGDVSNRLAVCEKQLEKMAQIAVDVDKLRQKIAAKERRDRIAPQLAAMQSLAAEQTVLENRRAALGEEIAWQEGQLAAACEQLGEAERSGLADADKQEKISAIMRETERARKLAEENGTCNAELEELAVSDEKLTAQIDALKGKLTDIENEVAEIKVKIDSLEVKEFSASDVVDDVKASATAEELTAQMEKLQEEINAKEKQIGERETSLVADVKRFRSVAELDVAISPVKAKDTILQVLETKYGKLQLINDSLAEKRRNFERAVEDYRYKCLQIDYSKAQLESQLARLSRSKEEEFKRDAYFAAQRQAQGDPQGAYAVVSTLDDVELMTLREDIAHRTADKAELVEKIDNLNGRIDEIQRHYDINQAEMESLLAEKNNILSGYNDIVSKNKSEAVLNYFKALESNNGTKFLLDVQHEAVKNETELVAMKKSLERSKGDLAALRERIATLDQNKSGTTLWAFLSESGRVRDGVSAASAKLSTAYDHYKSVQNELKSLSDEQEKLRERMGQLRQTVKVNEAQLEASMRRAEEIAGTSDIEKALADFRYKEGEAKYDVEMLTGDKQALEREIFDKKLELAKMDFAISQKQAESDKLRAELDGADVPEVDETEDYDNMRTVVSRFDEKKKHLEETAENCRAILSDSDGVNVGQGAEELASVTAEAEQLAEKIAALKEKQRRQTSLYVAAQNEKTRLAVLAKEMKTLGELGDSLKQNEVVKLLAKDKIDSLLAKSRSAYNAMTGDDVELDVEDCKIVVKKDGKTTSCADLDDERKLALYAALLAYCAQRADRWLVLGGKLPVKKSRLAEMLRKMDGVDFASSKEK